MASKKPARKTNKKLKNDSPLNSFHIVGIGASAGGLEALEQFLGSMPKDSGMAFVVIQHLDPNHKGVLRELLQRITQMQVITATDRLSIKPNCVYIIPPNKSMSLLNDALHLFEPIEARGLRLPIDYFFRSLADDKKNHSIGIILSGMGSDGSNGLRAIKEKGGIVMVQEPGSAQFDSMPRSAIEAVVPDIVAPANELPGKLLVIIKKPMYVNTKQELEKDTSSLEKIVILLRNQTGNDFSQYKNNTMYRRIERRMGIHQIDKINLYVRYLQQNQQEVQILFKELLIGVTSFFRDVNVWEKLKQKTLPSVISSLPNNYVLRGWIPSCSTGEEVYSIAIIFKEVLEKVAPRKSLTVQLFATDIDNTAIEKARTGLYPVNIETEISPDRLSRFFTKVDNRYRVNSEIREMVVFAQQNVIKDPPFTKLDLLSCRNLLIYLKPELQKKLLSLFHYSLNKNGILILGTAETTEAYKNLFIAVDSKLKIYQLSGFSKTKKLIDFPNTHFHNESGLSENQQAAKVPDNTQNITDQLILQQFSPASVLVTNQGDILYITGSTGNYLAPAAGKANMNIFVMAREGLNNELPVAIRKAAKTFEKVVLHNINVGTNGGTKLVNVTVQQIENPLALKGKIIVVFEDVKSKSFKTSISKKKKSSDRTAEKALDIELQQTKEELQITREEMQTSREELKSTNEELQSTNEELQSNNEELTTSKEEMQSLNEELHSLNAELQTKIDDSLRINNDMNNLMNSTELTALFLDKELRIRKFTIPVTKLFKLIPGDIGRPFTDQVTELNYPEMYNDAGKVLKTLIYIEKDVSTLNGKWFTVRIMPYRTSEDKIDGLVITFFDITKSKQLEMALLETQMMLRSFVHSVPGVIIGLSHERNIIEFNANAEILFGYKRDEIVGKNFVELFIPATSRKKVVENLNNLISGILPGQYEIFVKSVNGDNVKIVWSAHKLVEGKEIIIGIVPP